MSNAAYRSSTFGATAYGVTGVTATAPTVVAGDQEVAFVTAGVLAPATPPTLTAPAGWTLQSAGPSVGFGAGVVNVRAHIFTRKATGAGASATFDDGVVGIYGYERFSISSVDPNGGFGQVGFRNNATAAANPALTGITTARANSLVLACLSQDTAQTATAPAGMTSHINDAASGLAAADVIQAAAGATGTKTFTAGSTGWVGALLEIYSNNTVTVTESLNFTDSVSAVLKTAGAVVEGITFADGQSAVQHMSAAVLEALAFTDAVTASQKFADTILESLTFSDSQDAVLVAGAFAVETLTLSDTVEAVFHGVDTVTESLTLVDVVSAKFTGVDTVVEALSFADAVVAAAKFPDVIVEAITFDDTVDAAAHFAGSVTEGITFVDEVIAVEPGEVSVVEAINFSDQQDAVMHAVAEVTETLVFVDRYDATGGQPDAPVGGGWAPEMPRRKREKPDRILDDVLNAIEELDAPKTQTRKARQTAHRVVRQNRPTSFEEFAKEVNLEKVEEKIVAIVQKAIKDAKKARRRKQDDEIMLTL